MPRSSGGALGTSSRRGHRPRADRRSQIVDATLSILTEEGLHAWTTARLAERVGVSEATLFRHFEHKEEILSATIRHQAGELRRRISAYPSQPSGWEAAEGLIFHVLDYVEESGGGPLLILLGQASRIHPRMKGQVDKTARLLGERLTEALSASSAAVDRELDPTVLATLFVAIAHSSTIRWIMSNRASSPRRIAIPMLELLRNCADGEEP